MNKFTIAVFIIVFQFFSSLAYAETVMRPARGVDDSGLLADLNAKRAMPKRAREPWRDIAERRQKAFKVNPNDPQFARPFTAQRSLSEIAVHSANEASPVDGMLTEWWCTSTGTPDEFDFMWTSMIGTTVKKGVKAYVYLYSYLGDDKTTTLQNCSSILKSTEQLTDEEMQLVEWIQDFETDAMWLRDFGPLFVRDDLHHLAIEDAKYYPGRPHDDAQPVDFANRFDPPIPVSEFNLYFEGGNFLANGSGICLVSTVVLAVNPHYTEAEIRDMFRQELGCSELVIVRALEDYATGHVDMWLAWADQTTLIVGEYTDLQDKLNRSIIEDNVEHKLKGLVDPKTRAPINIVRMPMPSNCPPNYWNGHPKFTAPACPGLPPQFRSWRTYLNVLFINNTVVMPVYAQEQTHETEATSVWESLGFDVVPVKADMITPLAGQLHCLTKTIDRPEDSQ
ncbi:MAG: agmatine deiminase family protein [Gammaproteobacteria bacterium]